MATDAVGVGAAASVDAAGFAGSFFDVDSVLAEAVVPAVFLSVAVADFAGSGIADAEGTTEAIGGISADAISADG